MDAVERAGSDVAPQEAGGERAQPAGWGAARASLLCWLMPATTAEHSHHLRLGVAFLIHILFALLTVLLIGLLAVASEADNSTEFAIGFVQVMDEIGRELGRNIEEVVVVLGATIVSIEIGYLVLAAILMTWGARDEPIRASFANALRRVWLHTSHVAVATLLCGLVIVPLTRIASFYWEQMQMQPFIYDESPPAPPANAQPGTPAWDAYQAEFDAHLDRHREAWHEYWRTRPWYIKYDEFIFVYLCIATCIWILWALLRAIGADRPVPPIARPPTCETCGYNLTAAPMDGRCPECGETVRSSLGDDVRSGTIWQRRDEVGRLNAWFRCCWDAILRPRWFGQQLKTVSPGGDHRMFLAMHLPAIFAIAMVSVLACIVASEGIKELRHDPELVWMVGPFTGVLAAAILFGVALLWAGVIACGSRRQQKRNLMPAAMQAAAYLGGYLTLGVLFAGIWAIIIVALAARDWFQELHEVLATDVVILVFFFWLVPVGGYLGVYLWLVWRVTTAARYANR